MLISLKFINQTSTIIVQCIVSATHQPTDAPISDFTSSEGLHFLLLQLNRYYLDGLATSFDGSIDLDALIEAAVADGLVGAADSLISIDLAVQADYGVGVVTLTNQLSILQQAYFTSGDWIRCLANTPFQLYIFVPEDTPRSDYYNMTVDAGCLWLSALSLNFAQSTTTTVHSHLIQGKMTYRTGNFNGSQLTPLGEYHLPTPLSNPANLVLNFTYGFMPQTLENVEAKVCMVMSTRTDWDSTNNNFTGSGSTPSREIWVCSWWNTTTDHYQSIGTSVICNISYDQYRFNSSTPDGEWPVNLFLQKQVVTDVEMLDLRQFAMHITSAIPSSSEYIVGIEMGIWVTLGQATWTPQILEISNIPPPESNPIPNNEIDNDTKPEFNSTNVQFIGWEDTALSVVQFLWEIPALTLVLLPLRGVMLLVQQLSYLTYVKVANTNLARLYSFMNASTKSRWKPRWLAYLYQPVLNRIIQWIQLAYESSPSSSPAEFLNLTLDYWLCWFPINIIVGGLLFLVYNGLKRKSFVRVSNLFRPCSRFIPSLLWLCVSSNAQLLAFKCTSQLKSLGESTTTGLGIFNGVLCLLTLLITLLTPLTLHLLVEQSYAGRLFPHINNHRTAGVCYLSFMGLLRVVTGGVYGYIDNDEVLLVLLLLCSSLAVTITAITMKGFHCKLLFYALLIKYCGRVLLHIVMLLELKFGITTDFTVMLFGVIQYTLLGFVALAALLEFAIKLIQLIHIVGDTSLNVKKSEEAVRPTLILQQSTTPQETCATQRNFERQNLCQRPKRRFMEPSTSPRFKLPAEEGTIYGMHYPTPRTRMNSQLADGMNLPNTLASGDPQQRGDTSTSRYKEDIRMKQIRIKMDVLEYRVAE